MRNSTDLSTGWYYISFIISLLLPVPICAGIDATDASPVALEVELQLEEIMRSPHLFAEHALQHPEKVNAFYLSRNYRPAWHEQYRLLHQADNFLHYAKNAHLKGLLTDSLQLDKLSGLLDNSSAFDRARLDILLTDAFISLSTQAAQGSLDPVAFDQQWHYQRPQVDVVGLLSDTLQTQDIAARLDALLPKNKSYQQLVSALAFYRNLATKGDWPKLASDGPLLKLGMRSEELAVLRERLHLTGDLAGDAAGSDILDIELEQAVKNFQKRHGLAMDGVVGPRTRHAMNVSADQRVQQILLNLERWRWLPRDLGDRHIRIDMAGFRLSVHEKDDVSLSMRVIIGRHSRETPSFTSDINHLILNPYWNVPELIALRDLMPRIVRDPGYLSRNRIRVIQGYGQNAQELDPGAIDWSAYSNATDLPFRFRQDPGASNSLGQVKFMLTNPFAIILHDTPSKHLFDRSVRAYSSGCIRLEDPLALAEYVMGDDWQQADIREMMNQSQNISLALPKPIPVHMLYQTAWVEPDGTVQFRQDVYGRDRPLLAAMPSTANADAAGNAGTAATQAESLGLWHQRKPAAQGEALN